MNVEDQKFCFTSAGPNAILTSVSNSNVDDTSLQVFGKYVAESRQSPGWRRKYCPGDTLILDVLSQFRGGKVPKGNYSANS